jgi:hypothetical protein
MNNWKEYLFDKFPGSDFLVKQNDKGNDFIESYSIKRKNSTSQTEIVFQIFKTDDYKELFNVLFCNPDSPMLSESNDQDKYGFDGQGSTFDKENLVHLDDWLQMPLVHGWTEKTTYYRDRPIKTDLIWIQGGQLTEIPLKQNYLDKFGCLTFPIIPFVTWWTNWKLKHWAENVRIEERKIGAMT